jgi:hypothetical protein
MASSNRDALWKQIHKSIECGNVDNVFRLLELSAKEQDEIFVVLEEGGNAGQVLSTDGNGNLSWVDQSGGGISWSTPLNSNILPDTPDTYSIGEEENGVASVFSSLYALGSSALDNYIYFHNDISPGGYHLYFPADNAAGVMFNDGAGNLDWSPDLLITTLTGVGRLGPMIYQPSGADHTRLELKNDDSGKAWQFVVGTSSFGAMPGAFSLIRPNAGGHVIDIDATTRFISLGASGAAYQNYAPNSRLDIGGAITLRYPGFVPAVSPANTGVIYYDTTAQKFQVSENGGAYVDMLGGGGGDFLANGSVPMTGNLDMNGNLITNPSKIVSNVPFNIEAARIDLLSGYQINFYAQGEQVNILPFNGGGAPALRFHDNDASNFIGLKAPGVVNSNTIYTLPLVNEVGQLSNDGSAILKWTPTPKMLKAIYDFGVLGGAVGEVLLKDIYGADAILPANAYVTDAAVYTETTLTSSGGADVTISVGPIGDGLQIVGQQVYGAIASAGAFTSTYQADGDPSGPTPRSQFFFKTSADKNITLDIGNANLTAGKLIVMITYLQ